MSKKNCLQWESFAAHFLTIQPYCNGMLLHPGRCPDDTSFAAHFLANFHNWASAHDTRLLCSSLLDQCPYGGTRRASAHMHYKNPLQLTCMWTGVHMVAYNRPVPTLQESFAAHIWTGVHMVAHLYQCPNDIGDLCNTLLGRCPCRCHM